MSDLATASSASLHPVVKHFKDILRSTLEDSLSVVAIKALLRVIEFSTAATMMGLHDEMTSAQRALREYTESLSTADMQADFGRGTSASGLRTQSACELFVRHVSRSFVDFAGNFEDCKAMLLKRGERFAEMSARSRETIAELGHPFIRDGATVLTHGTSKVVSSILVAAAQAGKHFQAVLTACSGGALDEQVAVEAMAALLRRNGIPVTLVPDAAVASIMEQVDMAIVGAEAVVEAGGVINRTGTFQLGIVCKAMEVPLYVAAESVKFARLCPLNQQDLPPSVLKNPVDARKNWEVLSSPGVELHAPCCDYMPAAYITLLFTDLGVLTPAAVSDELIKLYQ
mmetsp:Transcript_27831/g.57180  ORF Transcript_27831/g.57180 Transcript_27831/m.57180 type:complete len:342 (+) Transcript_27831:61-1086(+)